MNWVQNYNNVYTEGNASTYTTCWGVTCKGYKGCYMDECICYVAFPCSSKGRPFSK